MEEPALSDAFINAEGRIYEDAPRKYDTPNQEIKGTDKYELMQFTGLLDKNGKEIYEGDILRHYGGGTTNGKPSYRDFSFGFENISGSGEYDDWTGYGYSFEEDPAKCEAIGNIYENPELLSGTN